MHKTIFQPSIDIQHSYLNLNLFDSKNLYINIGEKKIYFKIEDVNKLELRKKVNFKSLFNFIIIEILFITLSFQIEKISFSIIISLGIIGFLIFSDLFYVPLYKVDIRINSENYTFHFNDENLFVDFLILKDLLDRK
jgi:hypothetical protein